VFVEVFDDGQPAVVWLFAGGENAPGDHERWMEAMLRCDDVAGGRGGGAILIIDDGNPPPPAALRSQLSDVARGIQGKTPLAVITQSTVARAIITGLNLSGLVGFAIAGHSSVDAGIAWLARRSTIDVTAMAEMVAEARTRADSAGFGRAL
jgi:hypothetical protein